MSETNTANVNTSSAAVSLSPRNSDSLLKQPVTMMKRKHDEEDSAPPEYNENFKKATQEEIEKRV